MSRIKKSLPEIIDIHQKEIRHLALKRVHVVGENGLLYKGVGGAMN